jgi:hypothetical protein
MSDLHSRFDDIDTYFENLVEIDTAIAYSAICAKWLTDISVVKEIGYNPSLPLSSQPNCFFKYFDLLKDYGVSISAEEYLPTRSWFMMSTISAPLLLTAALTGKGKFVNPCAGNFPEDLYYIIHA